MAKRMSNEKADDGVNQLNQMIQQGEGPGNDLAGDSGKEVPEAPIKLASAIVGQTCPRKGCPGHLVEMSTLTTDTERISHLVCTSCKQVGGEQRQPR